MDILKKTNFKNLGKKKTGKVRDMYIQDDKIILISTDRHSSFDRIIAHIPCKGQVLNQISAFWFDKTKSIIPNHIISVPDPNIIIAKKCKPLPIEMVVRGYITGITDTALWTHYQKGKRDFESFILPEGMRKNQKLDHPVITPTTKSDEHDRPITPKEIVSEGFLTQKIWDEAADKSIRLFKKGQEIAEAVDLILVDTKYEFGIDEKGSLVLIDEIHTPDSSRYWMKESYKERFDAGKDPEYFDKEFLRVWFKENCDPYKDKVLPEAPEEMIEELSKRYIQILENITGSKFVRDESHDIVKRMQKNLASYVIS